MIPSDLFFETIQNQHGNHLPFVAYKKPNATEVKALLQTNDTVYHVNNYTETGFVFAPFDDTNQSVLIPLENCKTITTVNLGLNGKPTKNSAFSFSEIDKQQHVNLVGKGIKAIEREAFHKVVLSRCENIDVPGFNLVETFKKLLARYQTAFVYCWYHPKIGLWMGATPEILMNIQGNRFSIMALAGTQEYTGSIDVVWQNKEQDEQQIVTDFIIESLKPFVQDLKKSGVETVKAGNLLHLKTSITAKLNQTKPQLNDLVNALHPTPAVCGFPKPAAKSFILENEPYDREFYTGYLGELNFESKHNPRSSKRNIENRAYTTTQKSTQLYVNLRCMQIKDQKALVYVGGGITKTSNAEKEWEETVSKAKVIKSVLQ